MDYQFSEIEKKWQQFWADKKTFKVDIDTKKPKYYVLDMFPYPSGAGLHVGHPLGYIASDIFARYKRLKGFNVLHPMGYDSFGLPAEQYAIQTGQHPAITTEENIATYRRQLDQLGFSFDWDRELRTSSPDFYKWTQWIFMQLFNAWYNKETDKAESISTLIEKFETIGTDNIHAVCDEDVRRMLPSDWSVLSDEEKQAELLKYCLTYLRESTVNWCAALGTVLANDEVKDGFSERGGYPVEQKKMMQWSMRITAYADRLLQGLDTIDWPEAVKEMQRNWIGKSVGASVKFEVGSRESGVDTQNSELGTQHYIEVFTTRVDTIFGVTFLVLAPEHELVQTLTTPEQKTDIEAYITKAKSKSERDRMADTKAVTGAFTGSFAINPVNGEKVQIWIADYVLAGYGTGAVMAVPSGDQRDYLFAKKFDLPIIPILDTQKIEEEADHTKEGRYVNSGFINGMNYAEAIPALIKFLEEKEVGKGKTQFRMRDAIFGRQRYWGEPVPVYFKNGLPFLLDKNELPLVLPEVDKYLPTESGEPPLARATGWKYEQSTMPGWAGSSWYWYRYMDAKNEQEFASKESIDYWKDVDLYIGGSEHATGHLLYSRFWNKFLKDMGYVPEEEPFKKLINQGHIQGRSNLVYRLVLISDSSIQAINGPLQIIQHIFISYDYVQKYKNKSISIDELNSLLKTQCVNYNPPELTEGNFLFQQNHVPINIVDNDILNIEEWRNEWRRNDVESDADFVLNEKSQYICGVEIEKMSKSKYNVVNPDVLVERYGADTLRLYEMFLGPLEQSKPWNTNGVEGVSKFLRKFWKLYHDEGHNFAVSDAEPSKAEWKSLHKIIKKAEEDIERFSFNTSVSSFMICVNELSDLKCNKRKILEPLAIVISPYAPHICEELWHLLGHKNSISYATFPTFKPEYLVENEFNYPISFNGKVRTNISMPLDLSNEDIEKKVMADEHVRKQLDGKPPKKIIVVKGRIVNVVI